MQIKSRHALLAQLARFGASTGLSAGFTFGFPVLLHEWGGVSEKVSVGVGFATAYLLNILLLRLFVFRSKGSWRAQLTRYLPMNGLFRFAEYLTFIVLLEKLGIDYRVAMLAVLGTSAIIKFFAYRWVFADRPAGTRSAF